MSGSETSSSGRHVILQAFNWESHKHGSWWQEVGKKVDDIAASGFTAVWLPPASQSLAPQGYLPSNLYDLNSAYGSEGDLRSLLVTLDQAGVTSIADVVINHRVGTTQGEGGMYNRYDGIAMPWDETAVTSDSGGKGNPGSGDVFGGAPNIDHSQEFVRTDLKDWLKWLRHDVGFKGFRFDYCKGYKAEYVKEYIEAAQPVWGVGEYWDTCAYTEETFRLDYNQDAHRQRIVDWIDGTGGAASAFDFTTKGVLQEALGTGELGRLRDESGKPPGVVGLYPKKAVTFVENHDTGSTQAHWPFPAEHIIQGYAYILTHPGEPVVFYDHFYEWDSNTRDAIIALIGARSRGHVYSDSEVEIFEAGDGIYAAQIGSALCMKIGSESWSPKEREDNTWQLATSGEEFAVWIREEKT